MKTEDIKVGARVKCNVECWGNPTGTEGVVITDFQDWIVIQWEKPLCDVINKKTELQYLDPA